MSRFHIFEKAMTSSVEMMASAPMMRNTPMRLLGSLTMACTMMLSSEPKTMAKFTTERLNG